MELRYNSCNEGNRSIHGTFQDMVPCQDGDKTLARAQATWNLAMQDFRREKRSRIDIIADHTGDGGKVALRDAHHDTGSDHVELGAVVREEVLVVGLQRGDGEQGGGQARLLDEGRYGRGEGKRGGRGLRSRKIGDGLNCPFYAATKIGQRAETELSEGEDGGGGGYENGEAATGAGERARFRGVAEAHGGFHTGFRQCGGAVGGLRADGRSVKVEVSGSGNGQEWSIRGAASSDMDDGRGAREGKAL